MRQTTKDCRCSLWDIGITNITIEQTNFEILSAPKRGGSCLVYEALKKEKKGKKEFEHRVILKEFYPVLSEDDAMGITRKSDGELCVSEGIFHSPNYEKRLNKFLDSYEIMLELSKQSDSTDHSVTVLSLLEAYGTWYIEEAYDSGKLIFDYETPPTLHEFLTTMKSCLLVLKNLHQLGYYHLDLKPDNISITKSGVIKFWDIDSLVKITELGTCEDFLWSDGFSAPEIESAFKRPSDAPYLIGPWTDIYSVAQLFCYYCFKRPLQYMELIQELPTLTIHIPQADYYITKEHYMGELLQGEHDKPPLFNHNAIYLLKHFLLRALSIRPFERYQTIEEALEDLNTIIERCDATKLQPIDNFYELPSKTFSVFDQFEELEALEEFFFSKDNENYFATITGGSRENRYDLAAYYATKHRLDYDTILVATIDRISYALRVFYFFGQKPAEFNSEHILADLKQYCRDHKLLIILDNYDSEETSLLADDDYDNEIMNELLSFQDIPLHFLNLSNYNRLGSYISTNAKTGKKTRHPFFEISLNNEYDIYDEDENFEISQNGGVNNFLLALIAIIYALILPKSVSVSSFAFLGEEYGLYDLPYDTVTAILSISKYTLYVFLWGLILGILGNLFLQNRSFRKGTLNKFLQNAFCLLSTIYAFIYLYFFTFESRWVLAIYMISWLIIWLFLKYSK